MDTPKNLYYTNEHEWIEIHNDIATVGVTDYAQGELGDVVFVELPEIGDSFEVGAPFGTIEAVKAVADLYAPVSGEIVEMNENLEDSPELVNQSPYIDGWMVKIKMSDPAELDTLMNDADYNKLLKG